MKVLVQNPITSQFYQDPEHWTSEHKKALVFEDSYSAMQFCLEHELSDMQVVLKFPDEQYDLSMPVNEAALVCPPSAYGEPQPAAVPLALTA